jgi:hypothetical protein
MPSLKTPLFSKMAFIPHTQEKLQHLRIKQGDSCKIEYLNKDYFNGAENIEQGNATAVVSKGNIYFNVVDPYGMDKLVMKARVLKK